MGVDHIGGDQGLRQEIQKLWRELRRVGKATWQNASIGRAGIRVYDGGWIRIEDGGLSVTGTAEVSGYLNISGELTGSGEFGWSGPLNLTGPLSVDGAWELNGNGDITGDVDVTGDITVLSGGRIKVGNIVLDPSTNGGRIKVGGHSIYVNGAVLTIIHSSGAQMVLNNGGASLVASGRSLTLSNLGVSIGGMPTIARGSANNATVGTVYCNTSGQLFRVVN